MTASAAHSSLTTSRRKWEAAGIDRAGHLVRTLTRVCSPLTVWGKEGLSTSLEWFLPPRNKGAGRYVKKDVSGFYISEIR